jgi:hypothetical protein
MSVSEKIRDIQEHPERHRHTFEQLHACATIDGVLEMEIIEAHQQYASVGRNGGRNCDTTNGPCNCGAWH